MTGTGTQTAQERIARHQHAAEILRARSVLAAAFLMWFVCGFALDLFTHDTLGHGSLVTVLVIRTLTCAFHGLVLALLFRTPLPSPRVSSALVDSVFPVSSLALVAIADLQGGLTSPYVTGLFVILMVQAIATPRPWKRGLALAMITFLIWPVGLLVATRVDDVTRAQLDDHAAVTTFVVHVAVLGAAVVVVAWGGHVLWSLRQSVFESRAIGRYRLIRRIGKGGMGEVWRAYDRALRRDVALKILSPEHGRNPSTIARFEREIAATASLSHPNVVRVHDWGVTDDGVWYYAMELLDGLDLSTLVKRAGPLPPGLVVYLGTQAASGLAEAHRRGTIHRDVKPGNLFVVAPGGVPERIELLDFGIASVAEDEAGLTQAGMALGTPGFMAPEVIAGAPGHTAGDIYGLGATLYFAITGKNPRDAGGVPPSVLVPSIPRALDDVLVRCLDADPGRRPESADGLAAALAITGIGWTGGWTIDHVPEPPDEPGLDATVDADQPATRADRLRQGAGTN